MWYIIWILGTAFAIALTVGIVSKFEKDNAFTDDDEKL